MVYFDGLDYMDEDDMKLTEENMMYGPMLSELLKESWTHTPDFIELKNTIFKEFPIFVTDFFQKTRRMNHILRGANYYGRAETCATGFALKRKMSSDEPCVYKMVRDPQRQWRYPVPKGLGVRSNDVGKLSGEVYGVPLRLLTTIDKVKRNGEVTKRDLEMIQFTSSINSRTYTKAFIYKTIPRLETNKDNDPTYMMSCNINYENGVPVLSY